MRRRIALTVLQAMPSTGHSSLAMPCRRPHLIALAVAALLGAPATASAGADRWIVVLEGGADSAAVARDHGRAHEAEVDGVFRAALRGYAAAIPDDRVDDVRRDSRVAYVERDRKVRALAQTLPWGVDRVDADVSSTVAGDGSGAVTGVKAYVLDTGIDRRHSDLHVVEHVDFATGPNTDCNGHGTHVAGTLAARDNTADVVGVAPGAPLVGVKVLSCAGTGLTSWVIQGVDWVTSRDERPAVANMSLGGTASRALDDAVQRSVASGVLYAVAAGNDAEDACGFSPARAGAGTDDGILTVAATDRSEAEASFSNFGRCVDIWAPGVSILSTRLRFGTTAFSGTSMASAHVAGGGALVLSQSPGASPAAAETALKSAAEQPGTTSKDGRAIVRENVDPF